MSGTRAVEVMIFGKGGFEGSLMFTSQQIAIGREPAAMVRLDDPMVSLRHAVMFFEGDALHVRDLGSRTGTRVNGKAIGAGPVKATDEISIGPFRLRFTIHRSAAEASPASANGGLAALIMPTPIGHMSPTAPPPAGARESPKRATPSVRPPPPASVRPPPMPPPPVEAAPAHAPHHAVQLHTVPLDAAALRAARPGAHAPEPVPAAVPLPPYRPRQHSDDEETLIVQDSVRAAKSTAFADSPTARYDAPRQISAAVEAFGRDESVPNQFAVTQAASTGPNVSQLVQSLVPAVAVAATPPHGREGALRDEKPLIPKKALLPEHPEPIALARRGHDDEDEDEDDDADFVAPFDLLAALSGRGLSAGASGDPGLSAVEVVRFRDDRVISVSHLGASPLRLPGSKTDVGARGRDGGFDIFPKACGGAVTVRHPGATAGVPATESTLRLVGGMQILIAIGDGEGVLVHLVPRAPQLAPPRAEFKPTADRVGPIASSAGMHIIFALIMGIVVLGGKTEASAEVNEGRFATIDTKEIELEPPPPKPPDPEPVPTVDIPASKEPPMPVPNQPHLRVPKGARASAQEGGPPSASAQKILSALGGATGPALNVESITNLDAIPHGTGGFKVSGVVGKAPGDTLRVSASSGDTTVNTKSAAELGNVGRVSARATGDGVVRGRVTTAPPAMQGEGHLDRGEIQRVINAHIYQVQGCYERQLMKDPSLSGKVTFQWLITPSGSVASVRVGSSTLRSTEATTCIQSAIGRWTFPAPQGGSVTVTYPFSFVGN